MLTLAEYARLVEFQPIETLPWELDNEYDPPKKLMPVGVVLQTTDGRLKLIGHDIAGTRTTGCPCCSRDWDQEIESGRYTAWTRLFE